MSGSTMAFRTDDLPARAAALPMQALFRPWNLNNAQTTTVDIYLLSCMYVPPGTQYYVRI